MRESERARQRQKKIRACLTFDECRCHIGNPSVRACSSVCVCGVSDTGSVWLCACVRLIKCADKRKKKRDFGFILTMQSSVVASC